MRLRLCFFIAQRREDQHIYSEANVPGSHPDRVQEIRRAVQNTFPDEQEIEDVAVVAFLSLSRSYLL
jgi:hypothetical protein